MLNERGHFITLPIAAVVSVTSWFMIVLLSKAAILSLAEATIAYLGGESGLSLLARWPPVVSMAAVHSSGRRQIVGLHMPGDVHGRLMYAAAFVNFVGGSEAHSLVTTVLRGRCLFKVSSLHRVYWTVADVPRSLAIRIEQSLRQSINLMIDEYSYTDQPCSDAMDSTEVSDVPFTLGETAQMISLITRESSPVHGE